ncbi:hypothetical protein T484DRAFT_1791093 [Baffinella frigidus]|nr:hypothetical protein T484DRAFT_1791093 [Cryptophyta sp. CCMP2293]
MGSRNQEPGEGHVLGVEAPQHGLCGASGLALEPFRTFTEKVIFSGPKRPSTASAALGLSNRRGSASSDHSTVINVIPPRKGAVQGEHPADLWGPYNPDRKGAGEAGGYQNSNEKIPGGKGDRLQPNSVNLWYQNSNEKMPGGKGDRQKPYSGLGPKGRPYSATVTSHSWDKSAMAPRSSKVFTEKEVTEHELERIACERRPPSK